MRKLSLLPVLVLSLALGACGGDDDDGDGGGDGNTDVDAAVGGDIDAAASQPDAATGGGSAANLGLPCTAAMPCPNEGAGETCTLLTGIGSETEGFCTISCAGQGDDATCQNGFPGPGQAGCFLADQAQTNFSCGIICTGGPGTCPAGLGCFDTGQMGVHLCAGDEGV